MVVDARFAGGSVTVEADNDYAGDDAPCVRVELPGHTVWLFAHEAKAMALALNREAEWAKFGRLLRHPNG